MVSFSFTIFAFVELFFAVLVVEVLLVFSVAGALFTASTGNSATADFVVFAAFAGVTLAFVAAVVGFDEALLTDAFPTAGFAAACFLASDGTAGVDWTDFFFATGLAAFVATLLVDLATDFVFRLADEVADFAVGFDWEVSFLAICLLDQNFPATYNYTRF